MLSFCLYISTAAVTQRSAENALIYLQARDHNAANEISGYLHRENGFYVQYVEGPEDALDRLMRRIRRDWRHKNVRVLAEGHVSARHFSNWDMAFTNEETSSFRAQQKTSGGEPDIGKASVEEILEFMSETALSGKARSVADIA